MQENPRERFPVWEKQTHKEFISQCVEWHKKNTPEGDLKDSMNYPKPKQPLFMPVDNMRG